jgi:hypothetical protein
MARNNCESTSLDTPSWGVSSYDCYTNTGTNEVNGFATYSGAEELLSVSSQKGSGRSKVWSNTSNDDGSFGTCTVDDTCRTVAETSNMAACLSQTNSNDYTNNYLCYGTSGTNTGISSVSKSNYRNKYQVGSFDSNDNQWTNGNCSNAYSNYTDCRTKADVDAEVAWKTTDNWQCHTYSNGEVNALEQWNKNYVKLTGFPTIDNQGIGLSNIALFCRKQEDAEAQSNCLNTNQYDCWDQQDSNGQILMHFSKSSSDVNKIYNLPTSTQDDTYAGMSNFDSNCTSNDDCTSRGDAYITVSNYCTASTIRSTCYKEGTASSNSFGDEVSWSIVYDSNQLFGQYSTRVQTGSNNIKCVERAEGECSSKSNVCESKSNKCYTPLPTYSPDSNTNFFDMSSPSNFTYQSSMFDSTSSNCIADNSECTTLPYCSYMAVETNNSNEFVWDNIGLNDCSEPGEGKRYRWTLETNSVEAVRNPNISNSNHWRQVNTDDTSNSFCTPVNSMVRNAVETITNEADGSNILCQCQSNNNDHYGLRYYDGSFDSNTPSNIGYSSLSNLQSSNCESNECRARNYYTARERLVECTHPEELASNTQGELGVGEKYLDITLSENGLLCYNDNACSNLCLVSGPSTISTQIGDGIYNDEAQSNPAQCYTYGSSNQQNRFSYDSYAADGSLLTTMPTCTDLVGSNCSETLNSNCDYNRPSWSNADFVDGTMNMQSTFTDSNCIEVEGPNISLSNHVITYDTTCINADSASNTLMKQVYKIERTKTPESDNICIPGEDLYETKYIILETNEYCPQNCRGSWSGCTYDSTGHQNIKTWTTNVPGAHGGTLCTNNTGDVTNSGCQQPIDCVFSDWGGWSACPTCGTGADLTVTRTRTKTGPQYNGRECDGLLTESDSARCSSVKPCCNTASPDGSTHYDITYTNDATQPSTESIWNAFSETGISHCESSMTKTYTPNGTCTLSSGSHPSPVTKTNYQPCDVDCVLSTWTQSGTCPTHCGYGGSNKVYTASITTQKQGNGNSCQVVASNTQPNGLTTANSYSIVDSTVTATYTNGCPSTSLCTLPQTPTISISNITLNSVRITWTNSNGSIASAHITNLLKYKKTTDSEWVEISNSGSTSSYTLTNLDSSTSYQVQIVKTVTTVPYSSRTFSGDLEDTYDSEITSFYTPMDLTNVKIALDFNNAPQLIEANGLGEKQFFVYFSELEQDMKVYENSGDVEGFGNNGQWPWSWWGHYFSTLTYLNGRSVYKGLSWNSRKALTVWNGINYSRVIESIYKNSGRRGHPYEEQFNYDDGNALEIDKNILKIRGLDLTKFSGIYIKSNISKTPRHYYISKSNIINIINEAIRRKTAKDTYYGVIRYGLSRQNMTTPLEKAFDDEYLTIKLFDDRSIKLGDDIIENAIQDYAVNCFSIPVHINLHSNPYYPQMERYSKYSQWTAGKEYSIWVGSDSNGSFEYKNPRLRYQFINNNNTYEVKLVDNENTWIRYDYNDTEADDAPKAGARCVARVQINAVEGINFRINYMAIYADIQDIGGSGNNFYICNSSSSCVLRDQNSTRLFSRQ